jgi:RHS repeat-associated protein
MLENFNETIIKKSTSIYNVNYYYIEIHEPVEHGQLQRGRGYLGKDILGSVRGITDDYGQPEEQYEYDAFGKPYEEDLTQGMNLGYTGKPYDVVTETYNYGYRDYAPEVARFTNEDPIRDGSNWFAYVNNDPVNRIDLWGPAPGGCIPK